MSWSTEMIMSIDECEILINEIKLRPQIWDKDNPEFNNHQVTASKWNELSDRFGVPVETIKKKWNMLRIQFRRELRKQISHRIANTETTFPTIQPWKYFIPMLFMKNQVNFMKPISAASDKSLKIDWEDKDAQIERMLGELQGLENSYPQPVYLEDASVGSSLVKEPKPSLLLNLREHGLNNLTDKTTGNGTTLPLSALLENFQKDIINLEREKIEKANMFDKDDDVLFLHSILPYFKALHPKQKFILRTKIQELVCNFMTGEGSMADHSYASTSKIL